MRLSPTIFTIFLLVIQVINHSALFAAGPADDARKDCLRLLLEEVLVSEKKQSTKALHVLEGDRSSWKTLRANAQARWNPSAFTNPALHDPTSYRYLVNSVRNQRSMDEAYRFLTSNDPTPYVISASVVDSSPRAHLFEQSGFILESPRENFLSAAGKDQGVFNQWDAQGTSPLWTFQSGKKDAHFSDYESYLFEKRGLPSPDEVIASTEYREDLGRAGWNEVVIKRSNEDGHRVQVKAIFIVSPGYVTNEHWIDRYNECSKLAQKLGVPLITLHHHAKLR